MSVSESDGGQQIGRHRRADHQVQGVFVLGHQGGEAGDIHPCRIHAGLGLVEIEGGGDAGLEAALDKLVGGLLARQGILGELQPLTVGGQGQVGAGNLGNQADLHAAPRLLGGQELLQRLVLEAPHPAEQVQFVGADAEADIVLMDIHRQPRSRKVFGNTLEGAGGVGIDLREEIGALDLVLGPGPLDVQGRNAQVAVVLQGQGDQLPQLRVDKELLPGDVGHRLCGCARHLLVGRPLGQAAGTGAAGRVYFGAMVAHPARQSNAPRGRQRDIIIRRTFFISVYLRSSWSRQPGLPRPVASPSSWRTAARSGQRKTE